MRPGTAGHVAQNGHGANRAGPSHGSPRQRNKTTHRGHALHDLLSTGNADLEETTARWAAKDQRAAYQRQRRWPGGGRKHCERGMRRNARGG